MLRVFVSVVCKRVIAVDVYGGVNWLPEAVVFPMISAKQRLVSQVLFLPIAFLDGA